MPRHTVETILKETCSPDNDETRASVTKTLTSLRGVLTEHMINELPASYILNLTVLSETKNITADLITAAALSYALDADPVHRRELNHLLRMGHFILEQKIPNTTH